MSLSFFRSRRFLSLLALVVMGVLAGNFAKNGGHWRAEVSCWDVCQQGPGYVRITGNGYGYGMSGPVNIGDYDGNGVDDLIVESADDTGTSGAVRLVLMQSDGGDMRTSVLVSARDLPLSLGSQTAIAWLGDLKGDGTKAIAIGGSGANGNRVWIAFLNGTNLASVTTLKPEDIDAAGHIQAIGTGLANIGDLDGDGVADLAVGGKKWAQEIGGNLSTVLWIIFLNRDGTVKSTQKIADWPGFTQGYEPLLSSVSLLGDINGDGKKEIAVGLGGGLDVANREAVWVYSLNTDGTTASQHEIELYDPTLPGYTPSAYSGVHGVGVTGIGDWNADGVADLAIGTPMDNFSNGAAWIVFMNQNGTVKSAERIGNGSSAFGVSGVSGVFGEEMAMLNDLDGDGKKDFIVSEFGRSALWVLLSSKKNAGGSSSAVSSQGASSAQSSAGSSIGIQTSSSSQSAGITSSVASGSPSAAECANGVIESGEECEIGYSCPSGYTCVAGCRCASNSASSSMAVSSASSTPANTSSSSGDSSSALAYSSSSDAYSSSYSYSYSYPSSSATVYDICGNGLQENNEECEAGIYCPSGQYCSNCECYTREYCGDSVVNSNSGEECESDGDCAGGQFCMLNCLCHQDTGGTCGNGAMEEDEQCERDHPCGSGQQCQNCVCVGVQRCGNGNLERGEQCEVNTACSAGSSCINCLCQQSEGCGNGILGAGEQCEEDGQCADGQFCNLSNCQCAAVSTGSCGNGSLDEQEQCELGQPCQNADEVCDLANCSCVLDVVTSLCGNAQVDPGENCDIGTSCGEGKTCSFSNCRCVSAEERCGDAKLSEDEECDIGSPCADASKVCDFSQCTCTEPSTDTVCGNGLTEIGEECEVGMACPFGWSCDFPRCKCLNQSVCGNGTVDVGEQCEINAPCAGDDQTCDFSRCRCVGNVIDCGNAVIDSGEQCDDGNKTNGDGCSATCQREWQSMVSGEQICGNGIVEGTEKCDDGNQTDGDACSHLCQWETAGVSGVENLVLNIESDHAAGPTLQGGSPSGGTQVPSGAQGQNSGLNSQTIVFPNQQGVGSATPQQEQQQFPSFYGSVVTYASSAGPVGQTGPASVAFMAAGAAAGFAWARRKKRSHLP